MIGTQLNGRYRIEEQLGQGGMGVVYRAYDLLLDRLVAIKILNEASKTRLGSEGRARLLHEAQAAARLNHPNIVSIYDAGEANDLPYIVMELIKGESLYDSHPQTMEGAISIARQVCLALHHAHTNGIIHRDLKPENIIVAPDGSIKLTDFGFAWSVTSRLTTEGMIVGTVLYLAPEAATRQSIDARTDLYSLGVILYELFTGVLPFTGEDPLAVISQHLYSPVIPVRAHRADLPAALDDLITSLLEKQPEARPPSAMDVLEKLVNIDLLSNALPSTVSTDGLATTLMLERIVRGRLVGRERELADMIAIWRRTTTGMGHVLLLSGESGIGKTRLVRELIAQAAVSGSLVLSGVCYNEGGIPYSPFPSMIHDSFSSAGPNLSLPDFVLNDLITISPELRQRFPELAANRPTDFKSEQQHLFESIVAWCSALAAQSALVIFVDDIHWADSSTLFLLRHLARRMHNQRVLLVLTYREVEVNDASALQSVLYDLNRERLSTRMKLTRFDRQQTRTMLEIMLTPSGNVADSLVDAIYRETEGNPFFIEEVTKALIEEGKLCFVDVCWIAQYADDLEIPQSVRVTIQNRLARLPETTQEVLRLGAILGRQFDFDLLKKASDFDEDTLIDALENAENAQIISEVSKRPGRTNNPSFSFAHALIPTTLRDDISSLRRQRMHRRAAVAIEGLYPGDDTRLESLAYHFEQAGDAISALNYYRRAAERALRVYANQEAERYYRAGLDLESTSAERARLLDGLGEALFRQALYQDASKAWREAISIFRLAGDHDNLARLYARLARAAWFLGDPPLSLHLCQEGLGAIEAMKLEPVMLETSGMATLLHETARAYRFNDMVDEAAPLCEQALSLAERLGLVEVQAETLATLGILSDHDLDAQAEILARAIMLSESAGLWATASRAHINMASVYQHKTDLQNAKAHMLKARDHARHMGMPAWEHNFLGSATELMLDLGEFELVEEAIRNLHEIRRSLPSPEGALFYAQILEGHLLRFRGELEQANQVFLQCLEEDQRLSEPRRLTHIRTSLGEINLELGNLEQAENYLVSAIPAGDPPKGHITARCLFARVKLLQGQVEEAQQVLENAHQAAKVRKPGVREHMLIKQAEGHLFIKKAMWKEALASFEEVSQNLKNWGLQWYYAQNLGDWAAGLLLTQEPYSLDQASALLSQAIIIFDEIGCPYYARKLKERLDGFQSKSG